MSTNISRDLINAINKSFKGETPAYLLTDPDAPTNVNNWISTGSSILDIAISNKKNGGVPVGKITEISGMESSGKSLICAHLCAETQKRGGVAIYIDPEQSASKEFFTAVGVDIDKLVYVQMESVEGIYKLIDDMILKIRTINPDMLVCIIVDSLTAAISDTDLARDNYDNRGYATDKSIVNSNALKRITGLIARQNIALVMTSQLRQKLGFTGFGDKYKTSSGGLALQFFASVRIRLKAIGKLKRTIQGNKEIIGIKANGTVKKNRCGPPFRTAEFDIYFDSGIDNYNSWLKMLKQYNLVKKITSQTYKVIDTSGKREWEFSVRAWAETVSKNKELREYVYNLIADTLIMKYRKVTDINVDEIEEDIEDDK